MDLATNDARAAPPEVLAAIALLISQGYSLIAPGASLLPADPAPSPVREEEKSYDLYELAKFWGVSYKTVYRHVRNGKLKAFKVGRIYRVTETARREYEILNREKV